MGLPNPNPEDMAHVENVTSTELLVIREEKDYEVAQLTNVVQNLVMRFNPAQIEIFNTVLDAVRAQDSL